MIVRNYLLRVLAITLGLALPPTAQAQEMSGPARAVDGDSLEMTGTRIRLFGIDAPEALQTCQRAGVEWACGQESAALLAEMVEGEEISCRGQDTDDYGRLVAICTADRLDLAQVMVDAGLAVALPQFTDTYVLSEASVREQLMGIWGSTFATPTYYRSAHPREEPLRKVEEEAPRPAPGRRARPSAAAQTGCTIKGNHSHRGEWIYHLPGMPYYNATRPEAMFCSEAEAQAAGYRRAIVR
jgi:endonuclease YncB( thermonuclease family)